MSTTSSDREPILVVEADADLGQTLVDQLAADGHPTELARTPGRARMLAASCPPRLVVLGELDTPRGALNLLESIRGRHPESAETYELSPWTALVPVIVLSSRTSQSDLLRAFEAGADDFLPRTCVYLELRARMRAVLRRCEPTQDDEPLQIGPLTIDPVLHAVTLHDKELELPRLQYELLLHLAGNPKRVSVRTSC